MIIYLHINKMIKIIISLGVNALRGVYIVVRMELR
nr:MAG TPA: hypothetical protein [Caudoviricetes sp.]